jgi:hypothetical protein
MSFVYFILISLLPCALLAAPIPVVVEQAGEPIRLIFSDGREATLFESLSAPYEIEVKIDLTDNTCQPQARLARCRLGARLLNSTFRWMWTKNPDGTRIGQTMAYAGRGSELVMTDNWTPTDRDYDPDFFRDLGPYRLLCDDFAWAGAGTEAPARLAMTAWNAEFMLGNNETGISENASVAGAFGLTFERTAKQELSLTAVDQWFVSSRVFIATAPVGQSVSWQLQAPQGGICQVAASMDLNAAQAQAGAVRPGTNHVYVKGSDPLWERLPARLPIHFPEESFR